MTYATYIEDRARGTLFLCAQGHSGYAPRGQDIVCAGISVLCQTLVLYLREHGIEPETDIGDGEMHIKAPAVPESVAGFDFCMTGLYAISEAYPENLKIISEKS